MGEYLNRLVNGWRASKRKSGVYLFDADYPFYDGPKGKHFVLYTSLKDYIQSDEFGTDDTRLHIGLTPQPYFGDLHRATIFLLMMNPGLSAADYYAERNEDCRTALLKNLCQDYEGSDEYPFLFLDPNFAWHAGFDYWHSRLRGVARGLQDAKFSSSYTKCLSHLAKRVACLQLVPYHSVSFKSDILIRGQDILVSTQAVRNFAEQELTAKAKRGEALVFIMRRKRDWALSANRIYDKHINRQAYPHDDYVEKMVKWLLSF
jgi:hypothetical protein